MIKKSEKMVQEITEKRQMTQEVIEGLNKRMFINCLISIGIVVYISLINFIYLYAPSMMITNVVKMLIMVTIITTVSVFEVAYRKDDVILAITGIEFLVFSVFTLFVPKIYVNLNKMFCQILAFIPLYVSIYYIAKCIFIYIKTEKDYQNNLSDVKEIVKEESLDSEGDLL